MKVLVTGGAGFIGSNIVDALCAEGHQVVVLDNLTSGKREQVNEQAILYEADITDPKVAEILYKERPEVINHHAAQIDVRKSMVDPAFDARVNIVGLLNLLEAGRVSGVKKVVFASSGGAIYPDATTIPTSENYPPCPQSPYGVSKLSGEYYLAMYQRIYGIAAISLRYGNVFGPRQDPHGEAGVVSIFIGKLFAKETPTIFGDGEQQRDYVYVGDVVETNTTALSTSVTGTFNIGTGQGVSVNTLLRKIQEQMGTHIQAHYAPPRLGEAKVSVLDSTLARHKLLWEPKTTLEEGLKKTVEFFAPRFEKAR